MGHERDDRYGRRFVHASRSSPVRSAIGRGSTALASGPAVARHRGHQQPVHRPLGGLEQVRRLGRIEPAPTGRDRQLVMERRAEAEEALDRLAERQAESRRDDAVFGGRAGRLLQMVGRRLGLRRVEVLEKAGGEDVASLPEEEALLVAEGEDPGQFRAPPRGSPAGRSARSGSATGRRHRSMGAAIDQPGGDARGRTGRTADGHRAS